MFEKVMQYKPSEQDYKFWLVVKPSTWMMPILLANLITALAVHAAIFNIVPEGMLFVNGDAPAAEVAAPAEAAAPAEEAAAPAEAAPAAEAPAAE